MHDAVKSTWVPSPRSWIQSTERLRTAHRGHIPRRKKSCRKMVAILFYLPHGVRFPGNISRFTSHPKPDMMSPDVSVHAGQKTIITNTRLAQQAISCSTHSDKALRYCKRLSWTVLSVPTSNREAVLARTSALWVLFVHFAEVDFCKIPCSCCETSALR